MKQLSRIVSALALAWILASGAQATQYLMHDLGVKGCAVGINNSGQAVGCDEGTWKPYVWNGSITYLDTLGGARGWANATNNAGHIVGDAMTQSAGGMTVCMWAGGTTPTAIPPSTQGTAYGMNDYDWAVGMARDTAYLWHDGTAQSLGNLGSTQSCAQDVNNVGQVVGWSYISSTGPVRPFFWQDNKMDALPLLQEDTFGYAYGINDSGTIVGYCSGQGIWHGYVWQGGVAVAVGTLGGVGSQAHAINNLGQIVGSAQTNAGLWHAFLKNPDGSMVDLDTPGGAESLASCISENGWIGGYTTDANGLLHATVWEPVPEPASILSLLSGIGGVGMMLRRRR